VINGNLNVPDNAMCFFEDSATVTGNVTVGQNAILRVQGSSANPVSKIAGNLQANNCAWVALNPGAVFTTVVLGNVQIGNCTGSTGPVIDLPAGTAFGTLGPGSMVGGDLQCHNNAGPCVVVSDIIKGNVQIMNNVSTSASTISKNTIGKDLACQNNVPAPTGSLNVVSGNPNQSSEGQCKGF
jgi:hypothetical protein